ncbi:hypothetical protein HK101_009284 [Irineochytrium annulatum]|nr:hypothetical protein HK101_009284 [Irineochytrium annulatum]
MSLQRLSSSGSNPAGTITHFSTLEGNYTLRDEIQQPMLQPNMNIALNAGSFVTFITIKSVEKSSSGTQLTSPIAIPPRAADFFNHADSSAPLSPTSPFPQNVPPSPIQPFSPAPDATDDKAFFGGTKPKLKAKKPSISKPAFVNRIVAHEQLAKFLMYKPPEQTYVFFNVGRSFMWADYHCKAKDPLSSIHFKDAFVTCHDVNLLTRENLDTVIGFSTGDVLWYSPLTGKVSRLNRQGVVSKAVVTCIKWMPGSENLFMAAYDDGTITVFDKEKEDQNFCPQLNDSEM